MPNLATVGSKSVDTAQIWSKRPQARSKAPKLTGNMFFVRVGTLQAVCTRNEVPPGGYPMETIR